jgi:hypothetical protein
MLSAVFCFLFAVCRLLPAVWPTKATAQTNNKPFSNDNHRMFEGRIRTLAIIVLTLVAVPCVGRLEAYLKQPQKRTLSTEKKVESSSKRRKRCELTSVVELRDSIESGCCLSTSLLSSLLLSSPLISSFFCCKLCKLTSID